MNRLLWNAKRASHAVSQSHRLLFHVIAPTWVNWNSKVISLMSKIDRDSRVSFPPTRMHQNPLVNVIGCEYSAGVPAFKFRERGDLNVLRQKCLCHFGHSFDCQPKTAEKVSCIPRVTNHSNHAANGPIQPQPRQLGNMIVITSHQPAALSIELLLDLIKLLGSVFDDAVRRCPQ